MLTMIFISNFILKKRKRDMSETIFSDNPLVYDSLLDAIEYQEKPTKSSYACNDTVVHAKILQKHLFKNIQKKARLYTSLFCKEFYCDEDVFEAFKSAKEKNATIDVIIAFKNDDLNVGQEETINKYKKLFASSVTFKFLEDIENKEANLLSKSNNFLTIDKYKELFDSSITFKFLDDIKNTDANLLSKSNNFLTIDENSVRYELSVPDIAACAEDKIKDTEATACFNDTEGQVLKLNEAFDSTFKQINI